MDTSKLSLNLGFIVFAIFLCGCAAVGSKTIYRTNSTPNIRYIGYCELSDNEILTSIYPQTNDVFNSTITEVIENYRLHTPKKNGFIDKEDRNTISEICEKHHIDALLLTDLRFINTTYTVHFIPVARNLDTEVQMRLYDRQGNLLYSTMHNTMKGNSYMMPPPTSRTVTDGTKGAFKRIAKEMHRNQSPR